MFHCMQVRCTSFWVGQSSGNKIRVVLFTSTVVIIPTKISASVVIIVSIGIAVKQCLEFFDIELILHRVNGIAQ